MVESWIRLRHQVLDRLRRVEFAGPLLARLALGWVFAQSGWGKFQNLPRVVEFFQGIGIPNPEFMARFVAGFELVCGALLMIGLFTRFAAIPLIIIMIVAIRTALWEDIEGLGGLVMTDEFGYIAVFVWLALAGPGAASLDAAIVRWLGGGRRGSGEPARTLEVPQERRRALGS